MKTLNLRKHESLERSTTVLQYKTKTVYYIKNAKGIHIEVAKGLHDHTKQVETTETIKKSIYYSKIVTELRDVVKYLEDYSDKASLSDYIKLKKLCKKNKLNFSKEFPEYSSPKLSEKRKAFLKQIAYLKSMLQKRRPSEYELEDYKETINLLNQIEIEIFQQHNCE